MSAPLPHLRAALRPALFGAAALAATACAPPASEDAATSFHPLEVPDEPDETGGPKLPDMPEAPETPEVCDLLLEDIDPDLDCSQIANIVATGFELHDNHGLRRHLRLEDEAGAVLGPEYGACLIVTDQDCARVDVDIQSSTSTSITALLVLPAADPERAAALQQALLSFIESRPPDERVAVFRWGQQITQISTPRSDRARLEQLIASGLGLRDAQLLALPSVVAVIGPPLASVQNDHTGLRKLLVIGDADQLGDDEQQLAPILRTQRVALDDTPDSYEATLLEASDQIDSTLAAGQQILSYCALDASLGLRVDVGHVEGLGPSLALPHVPVPGSLPGMTCAPGVDPSVPVYPEVIEISMSVTQRIEYDNRVATLSKEPFEADVSSDLNAPDLRAAATLKLRGNGSIQCERKSLSLNFDGTQARHWFPGSATDKFFLLSMCLDDRYINQHTANLLMAEQGLFAPKFRMIELIISGVSQGVYLLVEKPQTQLERDNTGVHMIIRRGADTEGQAPEVKYSPSSDAAALADYEAFLTTAEQLSGEALLTWLETIMDLDQYLRWIALMSLLESGDYIDEVYFMSTQVTDTSGGTGGVPQDYFSISTWDQDDIFSPCHKNGIFELEDVHGLLNCAEARLDYAIFGEPLVYARYVDTLEQTRNWLDQARFEAANEATVDALLALLDGEQTRAAMIELLSDNPGAIAFEVAEAEIRAKASTMQATFAQRRALLGERITIYQQSN